jgi:hypothetical protein
MSEQINDAVALLLRHPDPNAKITIPELARLLGYAHADRGLETKLGRALRLACWEPVGKARPRRYMQRLRWPDGRLVT